MPKKKAVAEEVSQIDKNAAAVALGRLGGQKTAKRGSDYYRKIAAKRKHFKGGRPPPTYGIIRTMPKRSSKKDENEIASRLVEQVTQTTANVKNPAAVALGRLGGRPARAKKLSSKRRSEIARRAAQAMWRKRK